MLVWVAVLVVFWGAARRSRLRVKISSLFLWYHSRFRCLAKPGLLLGILKITGSCLASLSKPIVLSTNHRSRSRDGAGGGNLAPMGDTTPDLPPCRSNPSPDPHLSPFHQSPDDHVISRVFLVYKRQCLARENSNCLLGHSGQSILSLQ